LGIKSIEDLFETVPLTYGQRRGDEVYTCLSLFTGNAKLILVSNRWLPSAAPRDDPDKQRLLCHRLPVGIGNFGKQQLIQLLDAGSRQGFGIVIALATFGRADEFSKEAQADNQCSNSDARKAGISNLSLGLTRRKG
jgi:hypothetical protein